MKAIRLRRAAQDDRQVLRALLASHQMEVAVDPSEFLVAEINGELVGAARLEWEDQVAYLRPVVVAQDTQGLGVGRALVLAYASDLPELNVVARGQASGFYNRLGFAPMSWELVPKRYRQECQTCPDRDDCQPLPMTLTILNSSGDIISS